MADFGDKKHRDWLVRRVGGCAPASEVFITAHDRSDTCAARGQDAFSGAFRSRNVPAYEYKATTVLYHIETGVLVRSFWGVYAWVPESELAVIADFLAYYSRGNMRGVSYIMSATGSQAILAVK
eukprot:scaffold57852_cov16-Prasinocladus_malaysianus.AAC.1